MKPRKPDYYEAVGICKYGQIIWCPRYLKKELRK